MLRKMTPKDILSLVEIHQSSWSPSEISVKLGSKFLELFYFTIAQAPDAFTYLFEENDKIIAYSSGFFQYRDFKKRLIESNWPFLTWTVVSRLISGKLAFADILDILGDSKKLNKLRYPEVHWGAAALANEYKGTPIGKEAFKLTVDAVFHDLQRAGCGGCWGPCDMENVAMEKWLIKLGFKKVNKVNFRRRSILIYEKTFTR